MKVIPIVLNAYIEEFRNAGFYASKNDLMVLLKTQNFKAVQAFVDKDLEQVRIHTEDGKRESALKERMALHESKFRIFGAVMARKTIAERVTGGYKAVSQPA